VREGSDPVPSREELRREVGVLATLLCSKSRRATLARLAAGDCGGRPWDCEGAWEGREVVECERCGRSEAPLTCGCRWDVAAADMARLRVRRSKERERAWVQSDALCAPGRRLVDDSSRPPLRVRKG
jgi:hypothetical protein